MKISRILKSKWLWPLWFVLVSILLAQIWREAMATRCSVVWSPNKQFKVEHYFYGHVPIWDEVHMFLNPYYWPGFSRVTDKDDHVIERRDADNMSSICNDCILFRFRDKERMEDSGCIGNEIPKEYVGDLFEGGGLVIWDGLHRDKKEDWKVHWKNWQVGTGGIEVTTALPAPPVD